MDVMSVRWTLKRRCMSAGLEEYDGDSKNLPDFVVDWSTVQFKKTT